MSSQTEQLADQAIAKLEADDAAKADDKTNPDKGATDEKNDTDKPADDKAGTAGNEGTSKNDTKAGDKGAASDNKTKETDDKPAEKGSFTADDGIEVEDKSRDADQQQTPNQQLTTGAQKYIAENIGEPMTIRGMQGSGDNAKEVTLKVYTPSEIPSDFKFLNDREMSAASTGFYGLEQKANRLLQDYQQQDATNAAQDFEKRENEGIKADVADLQKSGKFPMFTKRPGESGFDSTNEAKQMQEVLDIMTAQNQTYMQQYQQGRPYKHIGFAEAFDLWQAKNSEQQAKKTANAKQSEEDEQRRKQGTERPDANRGMSTNKITKPLVKAGTTVQDIMRQHDNED